MRQIDGLSERPAHVDVAGVEILDHEERAGQVLQRLQELRSIGHFVEKGSLESVHRDKRILPIFGGRAIALSGVAG